MKTLALLSLSLAVALGLPLGPDVAQVPVLNEGDQSPLQGEWLPVQGHVVAHDPVPQVRLGPKEQQEPEVKVKPEAKVEPELKAEPEVKPEPVVQVEPEVKTEPEAKMEPEVKADPEAKAEPKVKEEPEVKTEAEVKVEQELIVEPQILAEQEVHMEPELKDNAELKVESELVPLFDEEQEFQKVQEDFSVQMNLEPEPEASHWEVDGMPVDVVRNYEMMSDPIMELEPLDDDDMFGEEVSDAELLEMEGSVQAAFQNQDPEVQLVPEEEGLVRERTYNLDPEPIMELEPLDDDNMFGEEVSDAELLEMERSVQATFQNQDPEVQLVPEEEHLSKERTYNLDPKPIMELEPEMNK